MTAPPPLLVNIEGGVARLTLNRPAQGNAIDLPLALALAEAATRCKDDAAIRCVVLTGSGRLFCAGGDLGLFSASLDTMGTMLDELAATLHIAVRCFAEMEKPFVVLVNGPAAGAGLSLAISGDIVLAAPSAHFTAAYGSIGLTADGGMTWLLPRLVGLRRAQEILVTNRRIQADEAMAIGLVTRVVADDRLADEGAEMAARLAGGAVGATGAIRRLLRGTFAHSLGDQLEFERQAIARAGASAEGREGVAAYIAKRPPNFEGA